MSTIFLLMMCNIFMTFAWYGHLKYDASRSGPSTKNFANEKGTAQPIADRPQNALLNETI
jgi:hypothetical protein